MKRRGFLKRLLGIGAAASASAQERPALTLSRKEIFDVLGDWSIVHRDDIPTREGYLAGLTSYRDRKIYISDQPEREDRATSVIHEMFHVRAYNQLAKYTDEEIDAAATQLYRELYVEGKS